MIGAAATVLAAVLATAVGYAAAWRFLRGLRLGETLGWSLAIGMLLQVAFFLLAASPAASVTRSRLVVLDASLVAVGGVLAWRFGDPLRAARASPRSIFRSCAVALICGGIVFYGGQAIAAPMAGADFWAIWGWKGKLIFLQQAIPDRLFNDPSTYFSHAEYPLLLPLLFATFGTLCGGWDDIGAAALYPVWQAATILALVGFLRRFARGDEGLGAAVIVTWFTPLYGIAGVGMAEVPLAFGFVLLAQAALDLTRRPCVGSLVRLAVACVWTANIKREGVLYTLAVVVCAAFRLPGWRSRAALAGPLLLLIASSGALVLRGAPLRGRDFDLSLLSPARVLELLRRGREFTAALGLELTVTAALWIIGIMLILVASRRSLADWLLVPLIIQLGFYVLAISLSAFGVSWLFHTAFARLCSVLVPTALLIAAMRTPNPFRGAAPPLGGACPG